MSSSYTSPPFPTRLHPHHPSLVSCPPGLLHPFPTLLPPSFIFLLRLLNTQVFRFKGRFESVESQFMNHELHTRWHIAIFTGPAFSFGPPFVLGPLGPRCCSFSFWFVQALRVCTSPVRLFGKQNETFITGQFIVKIVTYHQRVHRMTTCSINLGTLILDESTQPHRPLRAILSSEMLHRYTGLFKTFTPPGEKERKILGSNQ